jgi:hypothetical protein
MRVHVDNQAFTLVGVRDSIQHGSLS